MNETPAASASKERALVLVALALACVLAWAYLAYMAWGMDHMEAGAGMLLMPRMVGWGAHDLALVFLMWAWMMVGMMLPSAVPMILLFLSVSRQMREPRSGAQVAAFIAAYVVVWSAFSAFATLLQWALLEARLLSPLMEAASPRFAGSLLIAAGIFEFTPLKRACLTQCRAPISFLVSEWRKGLRGAWVMGLRHGLFCLGCCWLVMLLLFVLGVMNLAWIAALAAFVLLEKTLPRGHWVGAVGGSVFMAWGLFLLAGN